VSDLERRLKRIIVLVLLLGVAGGIVSMFPAHFTNLDTHEVVTRPAYGMPMLFALGAICVFGGFLFYSPRRGVALAWVAWTGFAGLTFAGMSWDQHFLAEQNVFPMTVGEVLIGGLLLLVLVVNPIVALVSDRRPAELLPASARLVQR
jgi:hypothetical protein